MLIYVYATQRQVPPEALDYGWVSFLGKVQSEFKK